MNSILSKRILPTLQQSVRRMVSNDGARPPRTPDNGKCINKIILMGRTIGEARLVPINDNNFASFTLVTNAFRRTKQNELVSRADFHKIYVYQPYLAKKCHDLIAKGTRIYIEGQLNYRKTDGYFFSNIVAEKVIFLSGTNQSLDALEDGDYDTVILEDFEQQVHEAEQK